MKFRGIQNAVMSFFGLSPFGQAHALPTVDDARYLRVMRAVSQWRTVGDAVALEQPYRTALAKVRAENPHLARPLRRRKVS